MGAYEIPGFRICEVISIDDENDAGRIKVRLTPEDNSLRDSELPFAYPLLPKMLHVMPKVGEAVYVDNRSTTDATSLRRYIGPIISQKDFLYEDPFHLFATSTFPGSRISPMVGDSLKPETKGAYPKKEDIAILGRKYSDIILTENDIRLRSGTKLVDDNNKVEFNNRNSAFIKLKYNPEQQQADNDTYNSTASIVADKILLLGNVPKDGNIITADTEDLITDDKLKELIEKSHELPYGDKLIEFLKMFVNTFINHTHNFATMSTCKSSDVKNLEKYDLTNILSNSVRIN